MFGKGEFEQGWHWDQRHAFCSWFANCDIFIDVAMLIVHVLVAEPSVETTQPGFGQKRPFGPPDQMGIPRGCLAGSQTLHPSDGMQTVTYK